jgi:hypothetical protein
LGGGFILPLIPLLFGIKGSIGDWIKKGEDAAITEGRKILDKVGGTYSNQVSTNAGRSAGETFFERVKPYALIGVGLLAILVLKARKK